MQNTEIARLPSVSVKNGGLSPPLPVGFCKRTMRRIFFSAGDELDDARARSSELVRVLATRSENAYPFGP